MAKKTKKVVSGQEYKGLLIRKVERTFQTVEGTEVKGYLWQVVTPATRAFANIWFEGSSKQAAKDFIDGLPRTDPV